MPRKPKPDLAQTTDMIRIAAVALYNLIRRHPGAGFEAALDCLNGAKDREVNRIAAKPDFTEADYAKLTREK